MTCNHNYAGGYCIHCLKKQPHIVNGKEQGLSDTSSMLKTPLRAKYQRRKQITSEAQYQTSLLINFLKEDEYKKGIFPKYAFIVKRLGLQKIREIMSYMKEKEITSPAYFFAIYRNNNQKK